MKMKLKQLILENFMMYGSAVFDFDNITKIKGKNGKGKSSIANAYTWLMFNMSYDLSDNPAVRRIVDGQTVDDVDVSVTAVFDIDGKEVTAKKVQKRTYSKDGISYKDDNKYYINDVPKTLKDFNDYFDVDMTVLKICSNINAFLAQKTPDMREFLFSMTDNITDLDIALQSNELSELATLLEQYTAEELEAMNKATKARIAKDLPILDGQIKEREHDITIKSQIDVSEFELLKNSLKEQLKNNIDKQTGITHAIDKWHEMSNGVMELNLKLSELQKAADTELNTKKTKLRQELNKADSKFNELYRINYDIKRNITVIEENIKLAEVKRNAQLDLWKIAKEREFDETSCICSYCGQEYPADKKEQLKTEFKVHKAEELKQITNNGQALKTEIDNAKAEIENLNAEFTKNQAESENLKTTIANLEKELSNLPLNIDISDNAEYKAISEKICEQEQAMQKEQNANHSQNSLKLEEDSIRAALSDCEKQIAEANTAKDEERLDELKAQRLDLVQAKADSEKILYLLDELSKKKNEALTESINNHFDLVKWKLYELAKNGNYKNCCIPTIDGMSLLDISANKAKKILGKLDICNSIQRFKKVEVPIFLDDCENLDTENQTNITNLIHTQLIMLVVTDNEKLNIVKGR